MSVTITIEDGNNLYKVFRNLSAIQFSLTVKIDFMFYLENAIVSEENNR